MKKYLPIILATLLTMSVFTGCAERSSSPEQSNISIANSPIATSEPGEMPDNSFSKEEYEKLLTLQLDGYEDMTVSDYQNRVWELTDTEEYSDLLERVSKSEVLYGLRDTNETACFLYYVLEPLTAEKWQSRNYSGSVTSEFPYPKDNAVVEYTFTLTILDADTLTVGEYTAARLSVINGMQNIIKSKTKDELQFVNKSSMMDALQKDIDDLTNQLQTEKISVSIDYTYFPLSAENDNHANVYFDDNVEQRRYPNGTEEDYLTLFSLKTPDYKNLSLMDFNNALLEWTNENPERMERISEDSGWNDFKVALTDEELSFVKLTVFLSGMENGKAIQSDYAGQSLSPYYEEYLPQKITNENGVAWCSLYYQFSYNISDVEAITVNERDRQIEDMINAIHVFWNNADIENVLKMSESDIVQELKKIAEKYSTKYITITTNEEQVQFECMDERAYID